MERWQIGLQKAFEKEWVANKTRLKKLRLTLERQHTHIVILKYDRDTNQEWIWDRDSTIKDLNDTLNMLEIEQHLGYEVYRTLKVSPGSKHQGPKDFKEKDSIGIPVARKVMLDYLTCPMHGEKNNSQVEITSSFNFQLCYVLQSSVLRISIH